VARLVAIPPDPIPDELIQTLRWATVVVGREDERLRARLATYGIVATMVDELVPGRLFAYTPESALDRARGVVDRLLAPDGCPWDRAQTNASLWPYLLEEAYELREAIDAEPRDALREEIGDVLLQPLMHAQIAAQTEAWNIDDVADALADKLIRRHPHVFGAESAASPEEVLARWDEAKRGEASEALKSVLAGVPKSLPALARALTISKRAARAGFEWPDLEGVLDKVAEEVRELAAESEPDRRSEEFGDLLFTLVNVARWQGIDPEDALQKMVSRFQARFTAMEQASAKPLRDLSAEEWDALWNSAKLTHSA
jgi:tetrapyrrole methylase family protein/MazG family protein